ncbi:MAG: phosphoglycerate dehydrogenase [Ignavibacteriae bacterium]|nr:phosphoglycerate dehydrogenase [Ignavibacteria bacterium]MBI3364163.1 phosphoglycerate dehydrogenase [Ignavibacteriota bacterium]
MNQPMNVLITDPVDPRCVDIFKSEGFDVVYSPGISPDEVKKLIGNAHVLIVRSQTQVTSEILEAGKVLKVVGRAGAGVDNIDVNAATRRGVIVMNTPGGNTISTAEHTISMMLALARNIPQAHQSVKSGKWDRKSFVGMELQGKILGIVGLGKVGIEVARRCVAFGMKILAYDPVQSPETASKAGAELVELDRLLRESDIVTVHSPLIPETKGLIGERALSICKKGVRIINCARGGIVDEAALLRSLNDGHVAGAALDVFEQEPPKDSPLIQHPKVIMTPHLGASTEEAQEKVAMQIALQVSDALKGRGMVGSVNADIIQVAMKKELQPYLDLAERIGRMIAQVKEGVIRSVSVSVTGESLQEAASALGAAIMKGLFEKAMDEPVNYLNAPFLARERGIAIHLHQAMDDGLYTHVLSVEYQMEKERRVIAGTVFGNKDLRIINVDGFHFEVKPEGHLLLYSNIDKPGMLANVSGILARANINIAGLSLGRYGVGSKALTIISTDSIVPHSILKEIAALQGVSGIKLITL